MIPLFFQMTFNGVVFSASLLLVALGFAILLGVMRMVNFAHGEWYMAGAFVSWFFLTSVGFNYWLAFLMAIVVITILGIAAEKLLFRPLRGQILNQIVVTLGLMLILQTSALLAFGTEAKLMPAVFTGRIQLAGVIMPIERLGIVAIAIAGLIATLLMWFYTKQGRAMRAFSQDVDAAALQGMSYGATARFTMVIASILAAMSGALMATVSASTPTMGGPMLFYCIIVLAIAGMGSVGGVIVGALIVGMVYSFASTLLGPMVGQMSLFGILILMLLVRPTGLWGREFPM